MKEIICGDPIDTVVWFLVQSALSSKARESLKISCKEIEEQPSGLPDEADIKLSFLSH